MIILITTVTASPKVSLLLSLRYLVDFSLAPSVFIETKVSRNLHTE